MNLYQILNIDEKKLKTILQGKKLYISISGMDNLGKSTQAKLLHEKYPDIFSEPLHINQTEAFPKMKGKELSSWWFNRNNYKEFVKTIYTSLAQRKEMGEKSEYPIVVLDKGIDFYDIRVKATLISMGISEEETIRVINETKKELGLFNGYEDLKVVIVPPKDKEHSYKREEEKTDNEDQYDKYLGLNIKYLNQKLAENKIFTPVEYVENDVELINLNIIKNIAEKLENKNKINDVEKIKKLAQSYFKDNLKMLILAGSTGKGEHIQDWSDIDFYVVLENIDHEKMTEFTDRLSKVTPIHIGCTFYSKEDIENYRFDNRTISTLYELQNGNDLVLFDSGEVKLPYIPLKIIQKYDQEDLPMVLNNLKRELYYLDNKAKSNDRDSNFDKGKINVGKILKTIILVEKLLLRSPKFNTFTCGYEDTSEKFIRTMTNKLREIKTTSTQKEKIEKIIVKLQDFDILELITNRGEAENSKKIYEYGLNLLEIVDLVGYNNNRKEEFLNAEKSEL